MPPPPHIPPDEDIRKPVTAQARVAIVQDLWPDRGTRSSKNLHLVWDAYFEHYTRECNAVLSGSSFKNWKIAIRHRELLQFIHLLEGTADRETIRKLRQDEMKRSELARKTLANRFRLPGNDAAMDDLIVLGVRILTMMTLAGSTLSSEKPRSACLLPWNTGSFQNAVHSYFKQPPEIVLKADDTIIGVGLTFYNIERVSGIKMVPTDNLLDHLLLVDEDKKMRVFHHASFLKRMIATQRYVT